MVSRGVQQLKNVRLYFCDYGGSSVGVREALQSADLAQFMTKNEHVDLEVSMKRNFHPYMCSTYVNGYVKEQSLRNLTAEDVLFWFSKVNKEFGKRPMKHNGKENLTVAKQSIQGQWHNTMWTTFPKHLMQPRRVVPGFAVEFEPDREVKEKKRRPHRNTSIIRKKYAYEDKNN